MLILRKYTALLGIALSALSAIFCPFLKVPIKGNWNLYETDTSLFLITMGILGLLVLFFVLRKITLFRFTAILYLCWTVLGLGAVYFKINKYFRIEMGEWLIFQTLHIELGWALLIGSGLIVVFSVNKVKEIN